MKILNEIKRVLCTFMAFAVLMSFQACTITLTDNEIDEITTGQTTKNESQSTTTAQNEITTTVSMEKEDPVVTDTADEDTGGTVVTQTTSYDNEKEEPTVTQATKTTEAVTQTPTTRVTTTPKIQRPVVPYAEQQNKINEIAEKYNAMGISVALINGGEVTDTYQYGWAVENERLMDENTKIRIASLSKVVLTMLAMQLYDEGKLSLEAPLDDYVGVDVENPAFPDEVITLRHLFTHVSSLTSRSYVKTWEKIIGRFAQEASYSDKKPGDPSAFEYNNYAFGLLGTVLDSINGMNLTQYANQTLFELLEVEGSFHPANMDPDELAVIYRDDHTVGLSLEDYQKFADSVVLGESSAYYAGGLTVSARDLAKIVSVLCNDGMYGGERVLSEEAVELMETKYFHFHNASYDFDQALTLRYQSNMYGRDGLYYHTGSMYGVYSFLSYDSETGSGIVVITTGAPKKKDKYDIYGVCGEISDYFYSNVLE